METNPIWYIIFWCFLIGVAVEFITALLIVNIRYYCQRFRRKRYERVKRDSTRLYSSEILFKRADGNRSYN